MTRENKALILDTSALGDRNIYSLNCTDTLFLPSITVEEVRGILEGKNGGETETCRRKNFKAARNFAKSHHERILPYAAPLPIGELEEFLPKQQARIFLKSIGQEEPSENHIEDFSRGYSHMLENFLIENGVKRRDYVQGLHRLTKEVTGRIKVSLKNYRALREAPTGQDIEFVSCVLSTPWKRGRRVNVVSTDSDILGYGLIAKCLFPQKEVDFNFELTGEYFRLERKNSKTGEYLQEARN